MKLTKYQHACFTLEKDGKQIIIDPGAYTHDVPALTNVVGIVVTHAHPDHFDASTIMSIIGRNPDAVIYTHTNSTQQLNDTVSTCAVNATERITVGPFVLEFFGDQHAPIHKSSPVIANLGVMIDDTVYYPGDSFTIPERPVRILALPVTAPWLTISDVVEFLSAVRPAQAFPTRDAITSNEGKLLVDKIINSYTEGTSLCYSRIQEPLEIDIEK